MCTNTKAIDASTITGCNEMSKLDKSCATDFFSLSAKKKKSATAAVHYDVDCADAGGTNIYRTRYTLEDWKNNAVNVWKNDFFENKRCGHVEIVPHIQNINECNHWIGNKLKDTLI